MFIQEMIWLEYVTLAGNRKIVSFPYEHTDKVDKPKPISQRTLLDSGPLVAMATETAHC